MLLGFLIMVAYTPNVVGAVVPTAWAVMLISNYWLLRNIKIEPTGFHILGLIFLIYASISWLWSSHGSLELLRLFALAGIFIWSFTLKTLKPIVIGLAIGLAFSAILACFQYFGFHNFIVYQATSKPSGFFINSNIFSEITGMIFLLLVIYKLWWFLPTTIPGLLVSSRATLVGLGITLTVWVWSKSKISAILMVIGTTIAFSSITNFENLSSLYQRFDIWRDTISGFTLFGNGVGAFIYDFPNHARFQDVTIERPNEAHNDVLQLIFDFGIGAIPLILMVALLFKTNNVHKYPLLFFVIIGQLGFPLHVPNTAFMAAMLAGYLANYSNVNWNFVYSFRSILFNRYKDA